MLLNRKSSKEIQEGITALHVACINNDLRKQFPYQIKNLNIALFNFLMDNEASMMIYDDKGFLPIHYAVIKDNVNILKNMHYRGINIFNKLFYFDSQSLLALAVLNGSFETVKFL